MTFESTATNEIDRVRAAYGVAAAAAPGELRPDAAWALVVARRAVLVDVRSPEERKFVGFAPRSIAVPWASGLNLEPNPRFVQDLEAKVKKDQVVLFLCRSGIRSAFAARAALAAGYASVFNVLEGFEGEVDDDQQRGKVDGWRYRGLPWVQE